MKILLSSHWMYENIPNHPATALVRASNDAKACDTWWNWEAGSFLPAEKSIWAFQRQVPLVVWQQQAGCSLAVSLIPSTKISSIWLFMASSPTTSVSTSPAYICLILLAQLFVDVLECSCAGPRPWWFPRGAWHPVNPDTTLRLSFLVSAAWAEAEGTFCWASNKQKQLWIHGGTSLWGAPLWLLECCWSYTSLAWFDARANWRSKTSREIELYIPSGPSDWKIASILSWNQTVQLLYPKNPNKLLGWALASCSIPINPAAWLAV